MIEYKLPDQDEGLYDAQRLVYTSFNFSVVVDISLCHLTLLV